MQQSIPFSRRHHGSSSLFTCTCFGGPSVQVGYGYLDETPEENEGTNPKEDIALEKKETTAAAVQEKSNEGNQTGEQNTVDSDVEIIEEPRPIVNISSGDEVETSNDPIVNISSDEEPSDISVGQNESFSESAISIEVDPDEFLL